MQVTAKLALLLVVASGVAAQSKVSRKYKLRTSYDRSNNFFNMFYFRDSAYYQSLIGVNDPSGGFVEYVSRDAAFKQGLAAYRGNQAYIGVDMVSKLSARAVGRRSVRLESKWSFDQGLVIADIAHMPDNACGIWPAFWTFNFAENPFSEIDIVEGNGWTRQSANTVTMHTCSSCTFPTLQGPELRRDCSLQAKQAGCMDATNPAGCGVDGPQGTWGTSFNSGGGGVYAMLLDDSGVKVWFFQRGRIPTDITAGTPDTTTWPSPQANFQASASDCNVSGLFKNQTLVINTAFCGDIIYDWKVQTTGWSKCRGSNGRGTCKDYVRNNPQAFSQSYWLFNSIKLYQV